MKSIKDLFIEYQVEHGNPPDEEEYLAFLNTLNEQDTEVYDERGQSVMAGTSTGIHEGKEDALHTS